VRALLRLHDFRWLAANMACASVGMMGEVVVLGWLALELTDSPFLVGLAMGARALPLFFVGVPAGVLADRWPRHRLLMLTALGQAVVTAVTGAVILGGDVRLPQLLALTLASGTLRGVEHATRQSYTHDVVGGAGLSARAS
jgi:MFS family permease